MTDNKPLGAYRLASYGAPSMPLSMVSLPLAVYLTPVYADSAGFGLSLGFVGLMLALSRVFDGITDRFDVTEDMGAEEDAASVLLLLFNDLPQEQASHRIKACQGFVEQQ